MTSTNNIIDITFSIKSGMVHWPSDPEIMIKRVVDMDHGDRCNVSHCSFGSHTGTHMDAPLHFIPEGKSLDRMPLDVTIGPVRVIEIKHQGQITVDEIKEYRLKKGERILFKTVNSARCWQSDEFQQEFVHIPHPTAEYLAKKKLRLVGVDYLSVGGYKKDGRQTHQALLGAGIWLLEGLNLSKVKLGKYFLICLPLKVFNSDGAPVRAVLVKNPALFHF